MEIQRDMREGKKWKKERISLSLLISLSLGETLLLEPFDGKVYGCRREILSTDTPTDKQKKNISSVSFF